MGLVKEPGTRETDARIRIHKPETTTDCFRLSNEYASNPLWTFPTFDDTVNIKRERPWGIVEGFMVQVQHEDKMERQVIQKFSQFSQVTLITRVDKSDHIKFNIYTSNLKYDRGLSENLIDQEMEIMDMYPDKILDFRLRTFNPSVHQNPYLFNDEKVLYPHGRLQLSPSSGRT